MPIVWLKSSKLEHNSKYFMRQLTDCLDLLKITHLSPYRAEQIWRLQCDGICGPIFLSLNMYFISVNYIFIYIIYMHLWWLISLSSLKQRFPNLCAERETYPEICLELIQKKKKLNKTLEHALKKSLSFLFQHQTLKTYVLKHCVPSYNYLWCTHETELKAGCKLGVWLHFSYSTTQ